MLYLLTLLVIKHFIIDFPAQLPYQWMNKGTYGHPGGIIHAALHALATFYCLIAFGMFTNTPINYLLPIFIGEFILHYHIDWAKMNINKHYGWECNKHAAFWTLTGFDQLLHHLTYIGITILCLIR